MWRGNSVEECQPHKLKVAGSTPAPATINELPVRYRLMCEMRGSAQRKAEHESDQLVKRMVSVDAEVPCYFWYIATSSKRPGTLRSQRRGQ